MTRAPDGGRRVHILEFRVHHGTFGACLIAVGTAIVAHDWHDRRDWLPSRHS